MRGVLKLEIEKHQTGHVDLENASENGSMTNDSVDPGDAIAASSFSKCPSNGSDGTQSSNIKRHSFDGKEASDNRLNSQGNSDFNADDVSNIAHHSFDEDIIMAREGKRK